MSLRLASLLLGLALLLGGCSAPPDGQQRQFLAMGTLVEVTLFDIDPPRARRLLDEVEAEFQRLHHDWHAWEESPLVGLNRALAGGETVEVPAVLQPLLAPAIRLSAQSDGLFNPAIGRLIALWGFQADEPARRLPDPARIAAEVAARPRMSDLILEGNRIRSRNPAVQLDFGGFAKGYAVDLVVEQLRRRGVRNAIVNAGGDLRAIGRHGERPWRIGIRDPQRPGGVLARIELGGDESVFTSGDYERYFEIDGRRYHHIIDPRSGWPAEGARSVTVIHPQAATADAAATALLIADAADWPRIARQMGIRYVLRVEPDGSVEMNPAMATRVQFMRQPPPEIRLTAALTPETAP
ncbi:FAD:protein FMN transferase [Thiohalobacter sp. IOR34]|uniref:FAD:protein FMN transferase n=1 Tax=Thiohalobacter sp. IOR34 TaxID=3057176 RepID=UPI0025B0314D|nr:FAD:protein FMN transferase [Thiohalobacter sp. IOR34]WJW75788.1 FAD:protein FMN transferase [Thiohalobacter sp. IOR34]